jgi:hypothetical protein
MKFYARYILGSPCPERMYNCRLNRVGRIAEKLFGILSAKFRVFSKPVSLHSYRVGSVVKWM